jgi:hypothetical protein
VTIDIARIGKSVTFTGTPTISLSNNVENYGSLILATGMTYIYNTYINTLRGRGSYIINANGITMYAVNTLCLSGTVTLNSDLILANNFYPNAGTFDCSGYNLTCLRFIESTNLGTRIFYARGAIITITTTAATDKFVITAANNTFNAGTSTIILTNSTANAQTFAGGGLTYNNVIVAGAGNYALTVTGSNTFKSFKVDASQAAKTITGTAATTQRVESFYRDPSANVITLNSTGAAWTLTGNSGYCELDYMNIANVTAGYKDIYYAGDNSTDSGGNTDITFTRKIRPAWRGIGRW